MSCQKMSDVDGVVDVAEVPRRDVGLRDLTSEYFSDVVEEVRSNCLKQLSVF